MVQVKSVIDRAFITVHRKNWKKMTGCFFWYGIGANFGANKKGLQFLPSETLVFAAPQPGLEPGTL